MNVKTNTAYNITGETL